MKSALKMLREFAARESSPVEIVQSALAKIERDNPQVNAWVHIAGEQALEDARASEARWSRGEPQGVLDGVPIGVKDLLAVAGQPMRRGSPGHPPDAMPAEDAPIVARLREAGAILIGKTATPDGGCKLDTTSLVHGTTRNPYDTALTAGGSSGGTAAALALGHVPIGLGTDGGGSIRIPAAFCGLFGMKPSPGRIPAPIGPFWPHAVTGPMSSIVLDTALAWNVATRPDARDPYAYAFPEVDWLLAATGGVAGLRVALATEFNGIGATPSLTNAVYKAGEVLREAGAIVEIAAPTWPCDPLPPFMVFWRCMYDQSVSMMPSSQAESIDPVIKQIVAAAQPITRTALQQAMTQRDRLSIAMAQFHQSYDLLVCPVMPCQPWEAGRATPPAFPEDDWSWCPFAYPFNMTRQPAASLPLGFDPEGLPLAVQIVAGAGRDDLVFRAAFAIEQAT